MLENDSAQAIYHKLMQVHRTMSDELAELDVTGCRMKIAKLNKSVASADKSLEDIESRFSRMDAQTVLDACIIGTTIEEMLADDQQALTLETRKFDTVIIDEAATMPIPELWALAYLASKSLVLVGDMRDTLAPAAAAADDVKVIKLDAFDETLEEADAAPAVTAAPEDAAAPDATVAEPLQGGEAELELFNLRAGAEPPKQTGSNAKAGGSEASAPGAPAKAPKAPQAAPARKPEPPSIRAGSITDSQRRERARLVAELFGEELIPETRAEEKRNERLEEAAEAAAEAPAPAPISEAPAEAEAPAPKAPKATAEEPAMTHVAPAPLAEELKAAETARVPEQPGWMSVDIFEYSGMRRLYELGEEAGNLIVLD